MSSATSPVSLAGPSDDSLHDENYSPDSGSSDSGDYTDISDSPSDEIAVNQFFEALKNRYK